MPLGGPFIVGLLLSLATPAVLACGYCIEDRIAATYDFAVASRAFELRHEVAFFLIEGAANAKHPSADAIARMLKGTKGIDRNSLRISAEPLALSFAFDPAGTSLGAIVNAADVKLGAEGLTLLLLRVINHTNYAKPAN